MFHDIQIVIIKKFCRCIECRYKEEWLYIYWSDLFGQNFVRTDGRKKVTLQDQQSFLGNGYFVLLILGLCHVSVGTQRWYNGASWRYIDVDTPLYQRCVPTGTWMSVMACLFFLLMSLVEGGGRVVKRCVSYVTGRPTDIGLQFGKACYPCSR